MAIFQELGETCLPFPASKEEWLAIEKGFQQRWNFPHCVGALDGKHVVIQSCGQGSVFYNYKGTNSIILMVLAGPNYEVIWINCGMNGRQSDGGIWNSCKFGLALEKKEVAFPPPQPLPLREMDCPYVIVADDAFALLENVMKPYPHQDLTLEQRVCNYRFSRARRIVENVFGILANRWRFLQAPIPLQPHKVKVITMAAVILHNWLIKGSSKTIYAPPSLADRLDSCTSEILPGSWREDQAPAANLIPLAKQSHGNKPKNHAKKVREEFKEYFNYEGQVSWQWAKCL